MANNIFGGTGGNLGTIPTTPAVPPVTPMASMNPVQQAAQNVINSAANASAPKTNITYVDNMEEMLNWPTSPNEHMYFAEKDSNIIWLRETDSKGQIQNPLKKITCTYEDVLFGPEANYVTKQEHQKLYDLVSSINCKLEHPSDLSKNYVTREEYDKMFQVINGINSKLETLING